MDNRRTRQEELSLPILVPNSFRIIAHRGASAYAPENTMAAFSLAERMNAREVELDVQLSRDGKLVICHDRALDRYGHPGIVVAESTLDELQSLDIGTWFSQAFAGERMLSLDQLFEHFGPQFVYHIEMKEAVPGIEQVVLNTISRHELQDSTIITSFHDGPLLTVRSLSPGTAIGWLIREDKLTRRSIERAVEIGCLQICPPVTALTIEAVREAHESLPEVRAHHVKTVDDAQRVLETSCDGLTINWPDWLAYEEEEEE